MIIFFANPEWKYILEQLRATNKPFKFKQGLDERLLTDEKCELLFSSKYDGDVTFAFDNIADYDLIKRKLDMIRRHTTRQCVFYVLTGFDYNNKYDKEFWYNDIVDTFRRIELLLKYGCVPYIMRFNKYEQSINRGMYINLARWCNQPSFLKKKSFREFCTVESHIGKATERYLIDFLNRYPNFDERFLDMRFQNVI